MIKYDYIINNVTIINEGLKKIACIYIKDGVISKITDNEGFSSSNIIDGKGLLLFPGIIDDHVHFRDPGLTHKGDITTESAAAIAGGTTSFMEMPNTIPQTTTNTQLLEKHKIAAEKSLANYSFYLGATSNNLNEIESINVSNTCGIKVFMGSSTGNMFVTSKKTLSEIFQKAPILVAAHCEDDSIIERNLKKYRIKFPNGIPFNFHPAIRSADACFSSSSMAVELAHKHNTRLHVLHLSTEKELILFENKPLDNKKITAEVCVHHLWFNDSNYKEKGSLIKWNPAIKSAEDQKALLEAVNNNYIDVIATDHAPHTFEEKNQGYEKAPSGGPMVQHSLTTMLELYKKNLISLEMIVDKMCHAPAKLFNIDKRGFIRKGYWADLVLVNLDKPWTVFVENIQYKCKWSPLEGSKFHSQIVHTFVNGNLVYSNGEINLNHRGKALYFNR